MTFLLDVNVLIALIDPNHVQHETAHRWFETHGAAGWATCPLTENGVLRVVGHPRYPDTPGTPAAVAALLAPMRRIAGHQFWPDAISLFDPALVDTERLLSSAHLTDTYLLALARSRHGRLATFDRRMVTVAVTGGAASLHVIGQIGTA